MNFVYRSELTRGVLGKGASPVSFVRSFVRSVAALSHDIGLRQFVFDSRRISRDVP